MKSPKQKAETSKPTKILSLVRIKYQLSKILKEIIGSLREEDVGITEFVSPGDQFQGTIKYR